jgi:ribosomal-protein-alanine N-acetyltransferase
MAEVFIRGMKEADLPDVLGVENMCFTTPWSLGSFKYELRNKETILKAAVFGNQVIGYVCLRTILDITHILNLAVLPEFRRMGIGSNLLHEALQELIRIKPDIDFITLEVRESNNAAINLYKKFGFRLIGKRTGYYQEPDEDAIIMSMKIEKDR